jgi:hypothetical protein
MFHDITFQGMNSLNIMLKNQTHQQSKMMKLSKANPDSR